MLLFLLSLAVVANSIGLIVLSLKMTSLQTVSYTHLRAHET